MGLIILLFAHLTGLLNGISKPKNFNTLKDVKFCPNLYYSYWGKRAKLWKHWLLALSKSLKTQGKDTRTGTLYWDQVQPGTFPHKTPGSALGIRQPCVSVQWWHFSILGTAHHDEGLAGAGSPYQLCLTILFPMSHHIHCFLLSSPRLSGHSWAQDCIWD